MAGRHVSLIKPSDVLQAPSVKDESTQRALDVLVGAVQKMQSGRKRQVVTFDLVVGTNRIAHSLGRPVAGYTITPTTADATFAHAIDRDNPRPDLEVWITVVGVAQSDAVVEIF